MTDRTYIRVRWLHDRHDHPDDPIDLWSELDESRLETLECPQATDMIGLRPGASACATYSVIPTGAESGTCGASAVSEA